jgi:hypothetical protein
MSDLRERIHTHCPGGCAASGPPKINKRIAEEATFFQSGEITVTNARFIVGAQTFAVRGITSVRGVETPANYGGPVLVLLFGVLLAVLAASWTLGILLLAPGVWLCFRQKPTFAVVLRTAGGEVTAYESKKRDDISAIIQALNNAIISSG